jgi:hypothetical protein
VRAQWPRQPVRRGSKPHHDRRARYTFIQDAVGRGQSQRDRDARALTHSLESFWHNEVERRIVANSCFPSHYERRTRRPSIVTSQPMPRSPNSAV